MLRNLPPLNALRAFEAAGRHQSFSRAAEELGVSHSSISRHVRGLEDRLGVQLFRDLPRGLALSRDGAAYLAEVSPALDSIAEATEALAEVPAGVVTVNSDALFAQKWLMPRLKGFYDAHPEVEIRLETSSSLVDVDRYEADLAFRFVRPGHSYPGMELLTEPLICPFAAPGIVELPLAAPRDLLRYRLFQDRKSPVWSTWFALAGGVTPEEVPAASWRMRSLLALEAAAGGQGVVLISRDVVASDVAAGRLVQVSDIGFREGGMYLVSREGVLRRKPVRVFRDWLLQETAPWRTRDNQPNG